MTVPRAATLALFHDPYFWATVLAGVMTVVLALYYIRNANRLVALVNRRFPDLWDNLRPRNLPPYFPRLKIYRLDNLILYGSGLEFQPDDPEFRRLLHAARWAAAAFLAVFPGCGDIPGENHPGILTFRGPADVPVPRPKPCETQGGGPIGRALTEPPCPNFPTTCPRPPSRSGK